MAKASITEKKCPSCLIVKPRSGFYEDARGQLVAYCIECSIAKQRTRQAAKQKPAIFLPDERWVDVEGYERFYQVSDFGRVQRLEGVRCTTPRILKTHLIKGYPCVRLCVGSVKQYRSVHSMVAIAFLGPYPEGEEVNHLDHNRTNPRLENLEYRTHKGNMEYASEHNRFPDSRGMPRNKLQPSDIPIIHQMLRDGLSAPKIAKQFDVHHSTIADIRTGRTWKHIPYQLRP